ELRAQRPGGAAVVDDVTDRGVDVGDDEVGPHAAARGLGDGLAGGEGEQGGGEGRAWQGRHLRRIPERAGGARVFFTSRGRGRMRARGWRSAGGWVRAGPAAAVLRRCV